MASLSDEIINDPLGCGYASMTPPQIQESLNAINRPLPVTAKDVRRYLLIQGKLPMIEDQSINGATQAERLPCLNIMRCLSDFEDFDLTDTAVSAAVSAGLGALVTAGLIDEADKVAVMALGDNKQSRGEEIGVGVVRLADVSGFT